MWTHAQSAYWNYGLRIYQAKGGHRVRLICDCGREWRLSPVAGQGNPGAQGAQPSGRGAHGSCRECGAPTSQLPGGNGFYARCWNCAQAHKATLVECEDCHDAQHAPEYPRCWNCARILNARRTVERADSDDVAW